MFFWAQHSFLIEISSNSEKKIKKLINSSFIRGNHLKIKWLLANLTLVLGLISFEPLSKKSTLINKYIEWSS